MLKWIPSTSIVILAATLVLFSGCKKPEPVKTEPVADTSAVLPEPPELDPIEDAFPEVAGEPALSPDNTAGKTVKKAAKSKAGNTSKATVTSGTAAGLSSKGAYTLQIGIYNTEKLAQKRADALKTEGLPAYVARIENPKAGMIGTYYRVRVGSFATTAAARAYGEENLTPAGIAYWADLKSRDSRSVVVNPQQTFKSEYETKSPAKAVTPAATPAAPAAHAVPAPPPSIPAAESPAPPANTESAGDTKPAPKLPDW